MFVNPCSPRGFTQDRIPGGVLNTFFEAARWAPSAFNSQGAFSMPCAGSQNSKRFFLLWSSSTKVGRDTRRP
nr:nitroreductase family protein [Bradyrhizobium sp. CSA112]